MFAEEISDLVGPCGAVLHYVVGDHAAEDGAALLSAERLRDLVPDLAEREVFLCGPPAMTKRRRVRSAARGCVRRRLHIERFALT